MAISKYSLCLAILITNYAFAEFKYDKNEVINGVSVTSGKSDSTREYKGTISKTYQHNLEVVKNSVINFKDKCNNSYKDRRKFIDKNFECKYHNENLVETVVIRDIKTTEWTKAPGEVDRFLLGRSIYNRGSFGYYELVQIIETKNEQNQKTIKITLSMLSDSEVKKYISPKIERDSAFDSSISEFVLTEIAPNTTELQYRYQAETEHWILNKEVSVPQVFASISKSINDLVKTVDTETAIQGRDVASHYSN